MSLGQGPPFSRLSKTGYDLELRRQGRVPEEHPRLLVYMGDSSSLANLCGQGTMRV